MKYFSDELPPDLNDIIDQISNLGIDAANNIQLHQNDIENQRAELIHYIRRLHSTRNNVDAVSNLLLVKFQRIHAYDLGIKCWLRYWFNVGYVRFGV